MLQTCMDHLNLHGTGLKNPQLESVVASVFKYIMDKPNFSTVFSQSVKITEINEQLLENLSDVLNLSLPERIGIGLALSDSENLDALMCGELRVLSYMIVLKKVVSLWNRCNYSWYSFFNCCFSCEFIVFSFWGGGLIEIILLVLYREELLYGSDWKVVCQSCSYEFCRANSEYYYVPPALKWPFQACRFSYADIIFAAIKRSHPVRLKSRSSRWIAWCYFSEVPIIYQLWFKFKQLSSW